MFRRFIPVNTVAAVGAQFAFASSKRSNGSKAKASEDTPMSNAEIKAANRKAALEALATDVNASDLASLQNKSLNYNSSNKSKKDTLSSESAYSQSMGFSSTFDEKTDGNRLNKLRNDSENSKSSQQQGAASHTGPQVAKKTKDEEQKMDWEGAMRPATAGQMNSDGKVETNYDIQKKAQQSNQAAASKQVDLSDAAIDKDANEDKQNYNAHNLPPTPLQELGSAISSLAGRLFHSKDSSATDRTDSSKSSQQQGAASHTGPQVATKTRDEEQKMDWEGAMRPATAGQMNSDGKVETNYDIQKKAQQSNSNHRISSSSGESQQSVLKSSSSNASRVAEPPSTFTIYGNYTPQAASHEAYATSSTGTSHETADSYNKKLQNASNDGKSPSTIQGISSTLSNATGGFFTRGSDAYPQYAGAQIQPTANHAGPAAHTDAQDANPLVGGGSSEGKSANNDQSSQKKEASTPDYSSPEYLVRRT